MKNNRKFGSVGEDIAAKYLEKEGYRITAKNVHFGHIETDIICENESEILFVEVKTRQDAAFSEAREAVDSRKQGRIRLAASLWLAAHETDKQPRFDVIEVYAPQGVETRRPVIRHWENAFV